MHIIRLLPISKVRVVTEELLLIRDDWDRIQAYKLIAEILVVDSFAFFRIFCHFPILSSLTAKCAHALYVGKAARRRHSSALLIPAL